MLVQARAQAMEMVERRARGRERRMGKRRGTVGWYCEDPGTGVVGL
jgi:hypothetical protein